MRNRIKSAALCIVMVLLLCFNNSPLVFASENTEQEAIVSVYYEIVDENGNIQSSGILPTNEDEAQKEMQSRSYDFGARTLSNGQTMNCFVSGSEGFWLNRGESTSLNFGLNRNAYIYSGIGIWNGVVVISSSNGVTGGRYHSGTATNPGYYYGFIRNVSTSNVTVTYANFSTPRL